MESGYGEDLILNGVNFTVQAGEIICIIGRSGCGKSTLLKSMLGLKELKRGKIEIMGTDMGDREDIRKNKVRLKMGVLFQRGALLNSISVGDNVGLPLELHRRLKPMAIRIEAEKKLALVGLPGIAEKYPTQLSGGMIKRAALARALALDPQILLCDEPSAGLDPLTTKNIDNLLLELKRTLNITIIVVTHDILSIERIADRVLMLNEGEIVHNGSIKEARISQIEPLRNFFLSI